MLCDALRSLRTTPTRAVRSAKPDTTGRRRLRYRFRHRTHVPGSATPPAAGGRHSHCSAMVPCSKVNPQVGTRTSVVSTQHLARRSPRAEFGRTLRPTLRRLEPRLQRPQPRQGMAPRVHQFHPQRQRAAAGVHLAAQRPHLRATVRQAYAGVDGGAERYALGEIVDTDFAFARCGDRRRSS